jgi:tetratricopeptide (TPR) repeat protein
VSLDNPEKFHIEYEAGKAAFERGEYRQAVQHLEAATALVTPNSRQGGEVNIWLITAYEAADQRTEAIALCQQLRRHPDLTTRKQSKRLLYILEAPQLTRRPEWLTEIPDLTGLADGEDKFRQGGAATNIKPSSRKRSEPEPIDLSQVNTKDNRFIWVALGAIALTLGGLIVFNF